MCVTEDVDRLEGSHDLAWETFLDQNKISLCYELKNLVNRKDNVGLVRIESANYGVK